MLYWNKLLAPVRMRKTSMPKTKYDYRSPFKKDFDTICNSSVLRRLQDKAQVFPLEEEDYARTRLTHSIEVLSIAESLGISLKKEILKTRNKKYLDNGESVSPYKVRSLIEEIPVILMGAALLHDMGNPPFGHLTEQIINNWFWDKLIHIEKDIGKDQFEYAEIVRNPITVLLGEEYTNDLYHFDGNAQLLRLVAKLSLVVDDNGMNLSFPVMASFIKYPCDASHIDVNTLIRKKAGYFNSESVLFKRIVDTLGLTDGDSICRHPLAYLLEAADDIAYLTADIEDAHHKGIITLDDVKVYLETFGENSKLVNKIVREIDVYKKLASNRNMPRQDDYVMHRLRILIKGEMINAIADVLESCYGLLMTGQCNQELLMLSDAKPLVEAIRELEKDKVYYCKEITESKTKAAVIINKLLDMYVFGILNYNKEKDKGEDTECNFIYESFSPNYRYVCEKNCDNADEKDIIYNKLRLVIDQISGMTDSKALTVYHILTASK